MEPSPRQGITCFVLRTFLISHLNAKPCDKLLVLVFLDLCTMLFSVLGQASLIEEYIIEEDH
jgi:hypothetical protein